MAANFGRLLRGVKTPALLACSRQVQAVGAVSVRAFQQSATLQKSPVSKAASDLNKVLLKEIGMEEKEKSVLPSLPSGWNEPKFSNDLVTLTRTPGDLEVKVEFSVNDMHERNEELGMSMEEEEEEGSAPMFYPSFTVTVCNRKNPAKCFEAECSFDEGEQGESSISINQIRMAPVDGAETVTFVCDAEHLDPELYESIVEYLQAVGVNERFTDYLVDLSRHCEHGHYINLLKDFSSFVESQ